MGFAVGFRARVTRAKTVSKFSVSREMRKRYGTIYYSPARMKGYCPAGWRRAIQRGWRPLIVSGATIWTRQQRRWKPGWDGLPNSPKATSSDARPFRHKRTPG